MIRYKVGYLHAPNVDKVHSNKIDKIMIINSKSHVSKSKKVIINNK